MNQNSPKFCPSDTSGRKGVKSCIQQHFPPGLPIDRSFSTLLFLSFYFIKMLRLQRLCGKSRSGASVPMCIKLQGAVVCRGPQQPTSETADVSPKDSPKRLPALDQQPCCPLESENVNTENPQQPLDNASFGEYLIVALITLASKYFCS